MFVEIQYSSVFVEPSIFKYFFYQLISGPCYLVYYVEDWSISDGRVFYLVFSVDTSHNLYSVPTIYSWELVSEYRFLKSIYGLSV